MSKIVYDITNHMDNFRFALVSLVDAFDRGSILYINDEQSDDFDIISEAIFRSFVIMPLIDAAILNESHIKFVYGMERIDGNLIILSKNGSMQGVFRQFSTRQDSFDSILVSNECDINSLFECPASGTEYFLAINS